MLENGHVASRLPCQDLERARRFYAEKLGLEPVDERPGGLLYRPASGEFALFQSTGGSPGTFTQMGWEVEDIDAVVAELRAAAWSSRRWTCPGSRPSTASPSWRATTRARTRAASAPRGSATARATSSASESACPERSARDAASSTTRPCARAWRPGSRRAPGRESDVAERRVRGTRPLRGLDAEPLGQHRAERLDLHLAEARQRREVRAQRGGVGRVGPDALGVAVVARRGRARRGRARASPSSRG